MDIETIIVGVVVLALIAVMYRYWPKAKDTLDVNHDGKLDAADAKAAVAVVEAKVVEEVKAVEAKVEEAVKTEVAKVVEEVKAVEAKVEEAVKTEVKKAAVKAVTKAKATVNKAAKEVVKETKAPAAAKKGGRPKKSA